MYTPKKKKPRPKQQTRTFFPLLQTSGTGSLGNNAGMMPARGSAQLPVFKELQEMNQRLAKARHFQRPEDGKSFHSGRRH